MELRQLEYFRQIADTHSFNEAARHLNMSQPPLSYQIHQLEEELGVQLFERTSKGVILTNAGEVLYERAGNLLDYADSAKLEVTKAGKKASSSYRNDLNNNCCNDAIYLYICQKIS